MIEENERNRSNYDLTAVSKNVLPLVKKLLGKKGIMAFEILTNWATIVGPELAAYSFPEKVEFKNNQRTNGTLLLSVPAGAFALELKHREKYILDKVNTFFGYAAVSGLKILQNNDMQLFEVKEKKVKKLKPLLVTQEEENYIKEAAEDVKDDKLKEILIKLGYSVFNENK